MVHIVHNLDPDYQGRIYLDGEVWEDMVWWTELPEYFTIDMLWDKKIINPSRCAIMHSDQWATVSKTYRREIQSNNSIAHLLNMKPAPFAFPNGVDDAKIKANLSVLGPQKTEKIKIIQDFFKVSLTNDNVDQHVLFGFVGRICLQKGVHLILETVEAVLHLTQFRAFFIIGGMIDGSEYSLYCQNLMGQLSGRFSRNFWANPTGFFTKGLALNRAADFFLMPSLFEPGGIVQHEALIAGTPVIAFKTGGLNDSIEEFSRETGEGNGFLFWNHNTWDYLQAVQRALAVHASPQEYAKLRAFCADSFITIKRVTKAWRGEFYRMFGKVATDLRVLDPTQPFEDLRQPLLSSRRHQIKLNDPHLVFLQVAIKTNTDHWQQEHFLTLNEETGEWTVDDLCPGTHE